MDLQVLSEPKYKITAVVIEYNDDPNVLTFELTLEDGEWSAEGAMHALSDAILYQFGVPSSGPQAHLLDS